MLMRCMVISIHMHAIAGIHDLNRLLGGPVIDFFFSGPVIDEPNYSNQ